MSYKRDDINLLLPAMRAAVVTLMERMTAHGFGPIPFDTARTPAEAEKNAAKGKGSATSVHIYGAACDLICSKHGWDCAMHRCAFFTTLGTEAEALGLTWGGRFTKMVNGVRKPWPDSAHVQGVSIAQQARLRALGAGPESVASRNLIVTQHLHRSRP